ncbi:MAG: helicase-related protein [Candidatus Pacearchaeota archaeon]
MDFLKEIQPREYQKNILETCISKNCLVILPTGLGKTLIALMLTIERLKKFPMEKVIFLAPTKPLTEQHFKFFKRHLPELFGEMQIFTGNVKAEIRKKLWDTSSIIFSTPQCVANDLKNGLYNLKEVCLLIEDEAHRCIKNYDYTYIALKYKEEAKNVRILGLTASPGSETEKIKEICKNLSIESVELRTRESPDVKPYLQKLDFKKVMIEFPEEFRKIRDALLNLFNFYIEELKKRKVLWTRPNKIELLKLQKRIMLQISQGNKNFNLLQASSACAQSIKIQHSLELLETQTLTGLQKYLKELFRKAASKENKGVIKLVSKPEFNYAFIKTNELLARGIEHPKILRLKEIIKEEIESNEKSKIIVFAQFRETIALISREINKIPGVKSKVFIGQGNKTNLENQKDLDNISGLTQKQQKKIIEDFSQGKINVLCATSIGEEGLDIPEVNTVIFYEPIPSAIRTIQRAGRTARLTPGKLIILITKGTRDEAHFYVSRAKEKRMHSAINNIKEHLKSGEKEEQKKL